MVDLVASESMKHCTYVVSWLNTLIAAPPLIASKEDIDQGVSALDESLNIADMESA